MGKPVHTMDNALAFHLGASCAHAQMLKAAQSMLHVTVAEEVSSALWPSDEPPLVFAARHGLLELARHVLCFQTNENRIHMHLDAVGRCGQTALHLAAARDEADMVRVLLKANASPLVRSLDDEIAVLPGGRLPLHAASASNSDHAITALLSLQEEVVIQQLTAFDFDDELPASVAWRAGHEALAHSLRQLTLDACRRAGGAQISPEVCEHVREAVAELDSRAASACSGALLQSERQLRWLSIREREKWRLHIGESGSFHTVAAFPITSLAT